MNMVINFYLFLVEEQRDYYIGGAERYELLSSEEITCELETHSK